MLLTYGERNTCSYCGSLFPGMTLATYDGRLTAPASCDCSLHVGLHGPGDMQPPRSSGDTQLPPHVARETHGPHPALILPSRGPGDTRPPHGLVSTWPERHTAQETRGPHAIWETCGLRRHGLSLMAPMWPRTQATSSGPRETRSPGDTWPPCSLGDRRPQETRRSPRGLGDTRPSHGPRDTRPPRCLGEA